MLPGQSDTPPHSLTAARGRRNKPSWLHPAFLPLFLLLKSSGLAAVNDCREIKTGQTIGFSTTSDHPACFIVSVQKRPAQVVVEQPEDLEIRARNAVMLTTGDGFAFGPETLTLVEPGVYRIDVRPTPPGASVPPSSILLREVAGPATAAEWAAAELQATIAKRSGTLDEIDRSAHLWEAARDQLSIVRTGLERADALLGGGDAASAQRTYEEAINLCRAVSDLRCRAEAQNNSGWSSWQLGDYEAAHVRLEEALASWRALPYPIGEGRTLSNLGLLYWQAGEFRRAIEMDERAADLLRTRDQRGHAWALNNLGLCYTSLAEYDQADLWFQRAIAVAGVLKDAADETVLYRMNLGRALMLAGRLQAARSALSMAETAAMQRPNRRTRAYVLNNYGQLLWRARDSDQAEVKLTAALQLHRTLADKRGAAATLHYLGVIASEQHLSSRAHKLLEEAVQIRTDCGFRDDAADSLAALAELELSEGNLAKAHEHAEKAVDLLELVRTNVPGPALRASYSARKRKLLDLLVAIAMQPGGEPSAGAGLLASERGRARSLLDLLAEGSIVAAAPAGLLEEQAGIRRQIDVLSLRLSAAPAGREAELRTRVQTLLAKSTEVEARIREAVADPRLVQPLESIERLRELVPADSAILEYHLGETCSHLWVVKRDSLQSYDLPARSRIDTLANRSADLFGKFLERRRSPASQAAYDSAIRQLSQTLLGPLGGSGLPGRLILVLDGSLFRVPFDALRVPHGGQYLGLACNLIRAPSASYLLVGRKPRSVREFGQSILAIADPVFSREDARVDPQGRMEGSGGAVDLARLPFLTDIEAVSETVPAQRRVILKGFDANPRAIRTLPLQNFAVLHFSTHAIIDDQIPELSRVALSMVDREGRPADGFLHPHELAAMPLHGSTVVLSACDTALGKLLMGEGLMGLTSSLLHAGAAQLVLSLTDVDAQASSEFFGRAYRRLFARSGGGLQPSMEQALISARRSMAGSARWQDPYYWAGFAVIGRPAD